MSWVKLDDSLSVHHKVIGLSDGAFRTYIESMCLASRSLSDGLIKAEHVRPLGGARRFRELVAAGLMDEVEGGYEIHDYLVYNPTAETVIRKRAEAAERMGRRRANSERRSQDVRANTPRSSLPPHSPSPDLSVSDPPTPHRTGLTDEQELIRVVLHAKVRDQLLIRGSTAPDTAWCVDLVQRGLTDSDAEYAIQACLAKGIRTLDYCRGVLLRRVQDREDGRDPDAVQERATGAGAGRAHVSGVQQGRLAGDRGRPREAADDFDDLPPHALRADGEVHDAGGVEGVPGETAPDRVTAFPGRNRASGGAR